MSDDLLHIEVVSADRVVWSGEATRLIARTTEGDVGILPNHAPILSLMVHGVVDVLTSEGETWVAAVSSGFLSVANNRVSILSEFAEASHDIDLIRLYCNKVMVMKGGVASPVTSVKNLDDLLADA